MYARLQDDLERFQVVPDPVESGRVQRGHTFRVGNSDATMQGVDDPPAQVGLAVPSRQVEGCQARVDAELGPRLGLDPGPGGPVGVHNLSPALGHSATSQQP